MERGQLLVKVNGCHTDGVTTVGAGPSAKHVSPSPLIRAAPREAGGRCTGFRGKKLALRQPLVWEGGLQLPCTLLPSHSSLQGCSVSIEAPEQPPCQPTWDPRPAPPPPAPGRPRRILSSLTPPLGVLPGAHLMLASAGPAGDPGRRGPRSQVSPEDVTFQGSQRPSSGAALLRT